MNFVDLLQDIHRSARGPEPRKTTVTKNLHPQSRRHTMRNGPVRTKSGLHICATTSSVFYLRLEVSISDRCQSNCVRLRGIRVQNAGELPHSDFRIHDDCDFVDHFART